MLPLNVALDKATLRCARCLLYKLWVLLDPTRHALGDLNAHKPTKCLSN